MELTVDNGKAVEPTAFKKAKAIVTRDPEAVITLSGDDIQKMLIQKLWDETPWLTKYNRGRVLYDTSTRMFTITFSIAKDE